MRALITGIDGFVGSHLQSYLCCCGDVVMGTHHSLGSRAKLHWSDTADSSDIPSVFWDIAQPVTPHCRQLIEAFEPQVIFHLAAISIPSDCGRAEPNANARSTNVQGTQNVIDLVATLPGRPRLVFTSSSQVYATVDVHNSWVTEDSPLQPRSGYAKSKVEAELLIGRAVGEGRIEGVIIRAFKHTGPGQSSRMMLPQWARQFANGVCPVQVRTLDSYIDIADVRDVVVAYREIARLRNPASIYNVGSGIRRRSGDLFMAMRLLADPERDFVETEHESKYEAIANTDRVLADVGWSPRIPLGQTIADVWNYWKEQANSNSV